MKPRVTEIIRAVGLGKSYDGVDPFYRDRGSACHKAIELYLKGTLDQDSIDESYRGHFEGFLKWWSDYKTNHWMSEWHLENDDFHGTIDLKTDGMLWDFKCSKAHDRVAEIQGAGYRKLALDNMISDVGFSVVQLPGDGTYKVIPYESPISLWEATWEIYKWKMK